jgi:putative FmdB family regulatory protein
MPTYDYKCDACGVQFELFQSITAPVKRKCPSCGKPRLRRLVGTGAGVLFKGSGFYETDYRSESYRKAAEAESKSAQPAADSKEKAAPAATASGGDAASKPESAPRPAGKPAPKSAPRKTGRKRRKG